MSATSHASGRSGAVRTTTLADKLGHPVRVILHAGMTKSGSTTLQNYLDVNRERVMADGILFPQTGFTRRDQYDQERTAGHKLLFDAILKADDTAFVEECQRFYASLKAPEDGCIILSAEEVFHLGRTGLVKALSSYLVGAELSLVFILRKPEAWLLSRYRDLISGGWAVETRSFPTFVRDQVSERRVDYMYWLDLFDLRFPDADIRVHTYEELSRDDRFLENAMSQLGIKMEPATTPAERFNKTKPIGIVFEALRRIAMFAEIGNRDLRQRWRQACFQAFDAFLTPAEASWKPTMDAATYGFFLSHTERVDLQLSAAYFNGKSPGFRASVPEDAPEVPGARIDALANIALRHMEELFLEGDEPLLDLPESSCLTQTGCLMARALREAIGNHRVIAVCHAPETAAVAATLHGRLIYAVGLTQDETLSLQMFQDAHDLQSAIICGGQEKIAARGEQSATCVPLDLIICPAGVESEVASNLRKYAQEAKIPLLEWLT